MAFIAVMAGGFVAMATGVAYARWWRREDDPSHLAEMFQDIDPEIPGG